jgi:nitrogen fixation-related uncharacterized protein
MDEATIALTITSLGVFAVFAGLFIWGWITGQFRDVEEPKYRMLEMDDTDQVKKGEDENG